MNLLFVIIHFLACACLHGVISPCVVNVLLKAVGRYSFYKLHPSYENKVCRDFEAQNR